MSKKTMQLYIDILFSKYALHIVNIVLRFFLPTTDLMPIHFSQKLFPGLSLGVPLCTLTCLLTPATSQSTAPSRVTGCVLCVTTTVAQYLRDHYSARSTSPSSSTTELLSAVATTTSPRAMFLKAWRECVSIL